MTRPSDASLATLLLTSRLVESAAPPLKAAEFWALAERVEIGDLLARDASLLVSELGDALGARIARLLDRAGALAFAVEEYEQQGIRTITAADAEYPQRWRARLGAGAPAAVHAAGPIELLGVPAVAVIAAPDTGAAAAEAASVAARLTVERERLVATGGAPGFDRVVMRSALDAGGATVAVLADALVKTGRDPEIRRAVLAGRLCIVTPYAPMAPFSAINARGRNRLIYALADVAFVAAVDHDEGETFSGAKDAIEHGACDVAIWTGAGQGAGNAALVSLGGRAVAEPSALFQSGVGQI